MKTRFGLVLLLVMALLGQASVMALPKPCHSNGGMMNAGGGMTSARGAMASAEVPQSEPASRHTAAAESPAHHAMSDASMVHDCCEGHADSHCQAGACLSVTLPAAPWSATVAGAIVLTSFSPGFMPAIPLSSPFRPPIA